MRHRAFWLVSLGHGSALLVVSAVLVHMVTHVTERLGYSLAQAATVVALLTVAQIVGHLGGGWAGDRQQAADRGGLHGRPRRRAPAARDGLRLLDGDRLRGAPRPVVGHARAR